MKKVPKTWLEALLKIWHNSEIPQNKCPFTPFLAMKHQNKSIWSSFTSSMAVLVGALIYLKFDIVIGLDTKLSQDDIFCYFIDSGRSHWVFFPGIWKCLRRISQLLSIFILVVSCDSFALFKLQMDISCKKYNISILINQGNVNKHSFGFLHGALLLQGSPRPWKLPLGGWI